ncbi:Glycosyltransferase involved in cell wall bisynthesis [Amycolatopsis xylanica]|uniref:Glycosyltransferase involved in cell wall bisynthesis n=1 Tax=Amycolatopsis xylanica TaxID=589385 RepID=A0A1H3PI28_9PSEU|nr:glycosyltransferase family 4 protein [Amycolatopsis xylanica]SDZ00812.1 Glycosyltransferase involved in cell wall bisynthesis [Amycolatopsis xylanica]
MKTLTGIDLPLGSPGGSVELLKDLYLGPEAPINAGVFMLGSGTAEPELLDVPGKQLDGPGFWSYVDALASAIRSRFDPADFGAVHWQHLSFGATPALLRAFPDHPRVALVHGTDLLFAADHPTQRDVLREAGAAADAVVVPTSAMADLLRAVTPVEPRRIVHVPWGIPDRLLHSPPPRPEAREGFRVLYAGRLTAEKGAAELIADLTGLPGVTLCVAAPEHEFAALTVDTTEVEYLGWLDRPALWAAFARHDLLVVPSTTLEAFGLVAVEAQACGLPVAYQPVPGLTEVLGDSALRVARATLAETVRLLAKDNGALTDLRAAGLHNAARFPLSRTAAELTALTAEVRR